MGRGSALGGGKGDRRGRGKGGRGFRARGRHRNGSTEGRDNISRDTRPNQDRRNWESNSATNRYGRFNCDDNYPRCDNSFAAGRNQVIQSSEYEPQNISIGPPVWRNSFVHRDRRSSWSPQRQPKSWPGDAANYSGRKRDEEEVLNMDRIPDSEKRHHNDRHRYSVGCENLTASLPIRSPSLDARPGADFDDRRRSYHQKALKRGYNERQSEHHKSRYTKQPRYSVDQDNYTKNRRFPSLLTDNIPTLEPCTPYRQDKAAATYSDEATPMSSVSSTIKQEPNTSASCKTSTQSWNEEETDRRPCAEDQFMVTEVPNQSTEAREKEPCYHPEQIEMASVILERMEEILFRNERSLRAVHEYENFEFIIYTAKSKMLEKQTISRLCDPGTECFPASAYLGETSDLEGKASKKVWMFLVENIEKAHSLMVEKVEMNPKTLYLIVADEAHSAVTKETAQKKAAAANNTVVNSWDARQHPNVIVLQVTATPFNLLTKRSRIPNTIVAKPLCLELDDNPTQEECEDHDLRLKGRRLKNVERRGRGSHKLFMDKKDVTAEYSLPVKLHHVRWSEQLLKRLASPTGVVMRIQVPCNHMDWLTINEESDDVFQEVATTSDEKKATEFLFQGQDGVITIHNVKKMWQLVVYDDKDDFGRSHLKVAFRNLARAIPQVDIDESFRMSLEYGEDIFQLEARMTKLRNTHGQATRKSVKCNPATSRIEIGMRDNTDENSVASLVPSSTAHSFFIDTRRNLGDTRPNASYISLNRMFNSMRFIEEGKRLLRPDIRFEDICNHVKLWPAIHSCISYIGDELTASSLTDVYAAVFAYWILVVENFELFRESRDYRNFDDFLAGGLKRYRQNYSEAYSKSLMALEEELRKNQTEPKDYLGIHPEIFKAVKYFYSNAARRELASCMNERLSANSRHSKYVDSVWQALAMCIIHMDENELDNVEKTYLSFGYNIKDSDHKRKLLNKTFRGEFHLYFEVEHLFEQDESCKVVSHLIHPFRRETNRAVKGKLIIVKVLSVPDGNRLYKTVCIARKVVQERLFYTFEILRDYGTFDITSVNRDTQEPLFRVRRKLQPEQCEYRSKDGRRCKCERYETEGKNLRCRSEHCKGKHKHKKVRQYEDMRHLSCLLILLKKGRLGDTFPDSFTTLDLRITTAKRPENFSLITQDLGRMCRYVKKGSTLPVALLGSGLYDMLTKSLSHQAVFHGPFIMPNQDNGGAAHIKDCAIPLDSHCKWVHGEIMPDNASFDFVNYSCEKHQNRILLEAEPQIGKTGVYLKLISVLRKIIRCDEADERDDQIIFEEIDEEQRPSDVPIDAEKWKFPFWKDMLKGPHLPKRHISNDSVPFEYNQCPSVPVEVGAFQGPTNIPVHPQILRRSPFLAHSSKHSRGRCSECNDLQYTTAEVREYKLNDEWIDISVPNHEYFDPLREAVRSPLDFLQHSSISRREKLFTWIFTPVRPLRCNTGSLNLRHTMVDMQRKPLATVPYIHILVVNEDEFEEYAQQWRSTHAIIKIPQSDGNAGNTRRFIQDTALCLGLEMIFILDDNVPYVYTCIIEQNGHEVRVKNSADKISGVKNIPLFEVLKHLESQFDPYLPPPDVARFESYDTQASCLHAYTGPKEAYGILGICTSLKQQSKAGEGFEKSLLTSLMLLNLGPLRNKNVHYRPWPAHADYQLSVESDEKNLLVCRYNRFVMAKSVVRVQPARRRHTRYSTESDTDGETSLRRPSSISITSEPLAAIPSSPDVVGRKYLTENTASSRATVGAQFGSFQCSRTADSLEFAVSVARVVASSKKSFDSEAPHRSGENDNQNDNIDVENKSLDPQTDDETDCEDETSPCYERYTESIAGADDRRHGSENSSASVDESDAGSIAQSQNGENGSECEVASKRPGESHHGDNKSIQDTEEEIERSQYEGSNSEAVDETEAGVMESQSQENTVVDTEEDEEQGENMETAQDEVFVDDGKVAEDMSPSNAEGARFGSTAVRCTEQCDHCKMNKEYLAALIKDKIDSNEDMNRLFEENTKLHEEKANLQKEIAKLHTQTNDSVKAERARNMQLSRMILELQEKSLKF